jgi:hypothetical protein
LQTERDKMRLLDGLESVNAGAGQGFDRRAIDATLSSLSSRVFLLNNVHEDGPAIFQTRWALSYLRGPLTQEHIRTLMASLKQAAPQPATTPAQAQAVSAASLASPPPAPSPVAPAAPAIPEGMSRTPALAQGVPTYFIPVRGRGDEGSMLVYEPLLLGVAALRFENDKLNVSEKRKTARLTAIKSSAVPVDWASAEEVELEADELEKSGAEGGLYRELPAAAGKTKSYAGWGRDLIDWLYGSEQLMLLKYDLLGVTSHPGEPERDFRIRLGQVAREQRDAAIEKLRDKYNNERARLEERMRKAEQTKQRETEQANTAKMQSVISLGSTLLDAFLGRKRLSKSTISKATTAARGVGRAYGQGQDVARADENIETLEKALEELNTRFLDETKQLETTYDPLAAILETTTLKPLKKNINVQLLALVWAPHWQDNFGNSRPAWS